MAGTTTHFLDNVFVGNSVAIGSQQDRYDQLLIEGETVEGEYKGIRDALILTDRRMIVINVQGLTGKKVESFSFPWRGVSAFSVEGAGTFDFDAELTICGSGWGVAKVKLGRATDVAKIARFIAGKTL